MEQEFKYFAFISYNSKDTEWGKKIQKKLEHYRMPSTLCSEHGWEPISMKNDWKTIYGDGVTKK